MITISSHVLNLESGRPAAGMTVTLSRRMGSEVEILAQDATNEDGRVTGWSLEDHGDALRVTFATGAWYADRGERCLYPEVGVDFQPQEIGHYHIPLLVNRNGYSTYRGS